MPPSFSGLLSSDIFEIIAESGQKTFFVHGKILAAQSGILEAGITYLLEEGAAGGRRIYLEDWDGETVGRFVEFLYASDYQIPKPEPLYPEAVEPEVTGSEDDRSVRTPDTIWSESTVQGDEYMTGQPRPLTPFKEPEAPIYYPPDNSQDLGQNKAAERMYHVLYPPATHNYRLVFLAHAKVYALAQLQGVRALQNMALQRLSAVLVTIWSVDHGSHLVQNIVELLDYVYTHTNTPADTEEPMRKVVSQFVALNFPALQSEEAMRTIMKQGGDLVGDLMEKVCRRLVNSEHQLVAYKNRNDELLNELEIARLTVNTSPRTQFIHQGPRTYPFS